MATKIKYECSRCGGSFEAEVGEPVKMVPVMVPVKGSVPRVKPHEWVFVCPECDQDFIP